MSTFELYLEGYKQNLLLDLQSVWVCKYPWKYSPSLGAYTVFNGKKITLLSMLTNNNKENYYLINGHPCDYRLDNIGKLEISQVQYLKLQQGYTSKYKGVSYQPQRGQKPWLAQKSHQGKRILQKYFSSEIEAAIAYNQATISVLGHKKAFFDKHLNEFIH